MENNRLFLGLKQVTSLFFNELTDNEKKGYVWFVRDNETEHFIIYLGTKKYGETNEECATKEMINILQEKIGLDENFNFPSGFTYNNIVDAFNDLNDKIEVITTNIETINEHIDSFEQEISGITNNIEDLRQELINDEETLSEAIVTTKDLIGLDEEFKMPVGFNYETIIEAIKDRYTKNEVYNKDEVNRLVLGAFKFKGFVEYIEDLLLISGQTNGDIYQVEKKSKEEPTIINSEFVWVTDETIEEYGQWIELGPLFDASVLDDKFKSIADSIGLTSSLTLPEEFKYDNVIEGINSLEEESKTIIVTFNKDDEDYNNPQLICTQRILLNNPIIDYPDLTLEEYTECGYWDTPLSDLRSITESAVTISYVTPVITRELYPELLDLAYKNGWCANHDYMTKVEAEEITDDKIALVANKLSYYITVDESNRNLSSIRRSPSNTTPKTIVHELQNTMYTSNGDVVAYYNIYDDECYNSNGEFICNISDGCYMYDKEGNKVNLSDFWGECSNDFYFFTNFDEELSILSNVTKLSNTEDDTKEHYRVFLQNSLLESINIPSKMDIIQSYTFESCSNLTEVNIEEDVTSIGEGAFSYCNGLASVTIPNSVTSIGERAFAYCIGLTSITIPNGVISIGNSAFRECSGLTAVTIPNSVTSIGNGAFQGCSSLSSVIVENNNPIYDSRNNCNAIIETNTNTLITGCKSTIIPNSVTSIGDYAFEGCSGLTSVTIPNSVTEIGNYAFNGCNYIETFEFESTTPCTLSILGLGDVRNNMLIVVPDESLSLYRNAAEWNRYSSKIFGHEHTMSFDTDGGTPIPQPQVVRYDNKAILPIEKPTKDDLMLDCWVDENDNQWDFYTNTFTSDITLKAKYFTPSLMSYITNDNNPIVPNTTSFGEATYIDSIENN